MESRNLISPTFIVFEHTPYKKGEKCEDDSPNKRKLLYLYPSKSDASITDGIISLVISIGTYANISLGGKSPDYISMHDKKIAISYFDKKDQTQIVFILISNTFVEEQLLKYSLTNLMNGLKFIFGPKFCDNSNELKDFFLTEGPRLIKMIFPLCSNDEDKDFMFSFPSIQIAEKHQSLLPTSLTELYLMANDTRIWGICCFVEKSLLVALSPISIINLFLFATPDSPQDTVYLTKENREEILNQDNIKPDIPDQDFIPATLLKFERDSVVFYVLTSPIAEGDLLLTIADTLKKSMPHIQKVNKQRMQFPSNSIMYDREMMLLRKGAVTPNHATVSFMHTLFNEKKMPAKDALLRDANELTIGFNTYGVENYSSVYLKNKLSIEEQYEKAKQQSPQIKRFLDNLK